MKKIGLVVGCSHSAGSEIDGTSDSEYNRDNAFGSRLSKMLGYEPINISLNGSANSGIARSVLQWMTEFYDPNEMELFVCIGWSESSRLEIPLMCDYTQGNLAVPWFDDSANSFWRINFGWEGTTDEEKEIVPRYKKFMAENPIILENMSATNVLMLQYMFKSLNIPYVMCNTMHMFTKYDHFTSFLVDQIDQTSYYDLRSEQDNAFYWKYKHLGYDNPKAKYWHHSEEPHRLYAEELYKFIGGKNVQVD